MTSKRDVAQWIYDEINRVGILYQYEASQEIEQRFGEEFVYTNENGNPAIHRGVLAKFRKLHGGTVEWDRSDFRWSRA